MQVVRPAQSLSLGLTRLTGEMYPLSHDKSPSSMLLISSNNEFFAYFGDTGPDDVENPKSGYGLAQTGGEGYTTTTERDDY